MPLPEMRDDRSAPGRNTLLSDELPELRNQDGQKIDKLEITQRRQGRREQLIESNISNATYDHQEKPLNKG
jgi:hypothetical protein